MSPEDSTERHDRFVEAICSYFAKVTTKENRFDIVGDCIHGNAFIPHESGPIFFDILVNHTRPRNLTQLVFECKTRIDYNTNSINSLKNELKIFFKKSYKAIDHLKSVYRDNYQFFFISNIPFRMWNNNITIKYIKEALREEFNPLDEDKISDLKQKVKIIILTEWILEFVKGEWTT